MYYIHTYFYEYRHNVYKGVGPVFNQKIKGLTLTIYSTRKGKGLDFHLLWLYKKCVWGYHIKKNIEILIQNGGYRTAHLKYLFQEGYNGRWYCSEIALSEAKYLINGSFIYERLGPIKKVK